MIEERIILDMLSTNSVSIVRQKYYIENENSYPIGPEHRKALSNTDEGVNDAIDELPEPHLTTLLTMWGKTELLKNKEVTINGNKKSYL